MASKFLYLWKKYNHSSSFFYSLLTERIILLAGVDPVQLYGFNDINLDLFPRFFPGCKLVDLGLVLKCTGNDEEIFGF